MSSTKYAIKSRSARLILQLSVIKGVENFETPLLLVSYFGRICSGVVSLLLSLLSPSLPTGDLLIRERCTISKLKGRSQEGLGANLPKFLDSASSFAPRIISSFYPPVKVILFPNIERERLNKIGVPNRAEQGRAGRNGGGFGGKMLLVYYLEEITPARESPVGLVIFFFFPFFAPLTPEGTKCRDVRAGDLKSAARNV